MEPKLTATDLKGLLDEARAEYARARSEREPARLRFVEADARMDRASSALNKLEEQWRRRVDRDAREAAERSRVSG